MKRSTKFREQASALLATMLVILILTACIGTAVHLTSTTSRQTDSSRDFSALRSASEGALDFAYGVWLQKVNTAYGPVSNTILSSALATKPSFTGFSYDTAAGYSAPQITAIDLQSNYGAPYATAGATPPATKVNLDKYPGWLGFNTTYLASVKMTGKLSNSRTVSYGVKRSINYTVVPLFQATAFFEDNLELYKTAPMTIDGLVATNSEAYVSQRQEDVGDLTFTGNLSYAVNYVDNVAPPKADTWSGYTPNSAFTPNYSVGVDQQVDQVNRMEVLGLDAAGNLSTKDSNPNNDSAREIIEPPNTYVDPITQKIITTASASDPQAISDRRIYNKAGIRIRVSGSSYTITTANGTTLTSSQKTALTNALSKQSVYDRREGKTVDITTLDIGAAKNTLQAASNFNRILYIDDTTSTGYNDPKAVRLTNGSTLPTNGLTVASQNPVYIQGDYNTGGSKPSSAVFADAVTILSNGWKDNTAGSALSARKASDTTVNTAIVAGFLPSGWVNPATGAEYGYSGGLNNFPRFLEDWTNKDFNYMGSMIELFTSAIGTGMWDTGNIYVPPNRNWRFDATFVDDPPPGSLTAVTVARGALVRF